MSEQISASVECPKCGCRFTFDANVDGSTFVGCPSCGAAITVNILTEDDEDDDE
jgi:uncharacterized Zn-finger protein